MRKTVLAILIVLCALTQGLAQQPVVKPSQYTVLLERRVQMVYDPECIEWVQHVSSGMTPAGDCVPINDGGNISPYGGYCPVLDPDCSACRYETPSVVTSIYLGSTPFNIGSVLFLNLTPGTDTVRYDTFHVYQPQFNITKFETVVTDYKVIWPYVPYQPFDIYCHPDVHTDQIVPTGEFFTGTMFLAVNMKYIITAHVRIVPNLEPTYTLPSHDKIQIAQTSNINWTPVWQYQDTLMPSNAWVDIPASFTKNGGHTLEISGVDLFGSNYVDFLHSTVKFRVRNASNTIFSEAVPYTLRLSSPHITGVQTTNLECFERHDGSIRIQFDRALLPNETLNILLHDTANKVSYSALNLSSLAPDNSYTWKNELRAGTYMVTLLGKYAKGLPYDTYINTRDGSVSLYTALNSVNFEDGFNTPDEDDFDSYTDYTGYAQATYTGAVSHIAFLHLFQPNKIRFIAKVDSMVRCKGMATGVITLAADGGKYNYKYSLKHDTATEWTPWQHFDNNTVHAFTLSNPNFTTQAGVRTKVRNLAAGNYQVRVRDMVDCFVKDELGNEATYYFTITEPEKGITIDLLEISPITHPDSTNGGIKVHISGGTPFINGEIFHYPYDVVWVDSTTGQQVASNQITNTILEPNKRMETVVTGLPEGVYYLRIYDASYALETPPDNAGCFLELKLSLRKPDPLIVHIETRRPISCYDSANAELIAIPSGGIPIDSLRYTFRWFNVTGGGNVALDVTDSLITDLGPGDYRVEITDKYNNTKLSDAFTLTQPSPLQLQLSTTDASCYSTADGTLNVLVTGGTPYEDGYRYEWSTGDRTAFVEGVAGGNYLVVVTDSMFCMAIDTISVTSPLRIITENTVQPVTCRDACDASISVNATGGTGVYTWLWSNGATTAAVNNLCPGTYWYRVTDASGCPDSDTIIIDNPDTLFVSLGDDRKICIGQTIRLDATASDTAVLTYSWTSDNSFIANVPKVAITEAGTYIVSVSNQRGCIVKDTIVFTAENSTINTDFVVSTQAFVNEPVTLVNISQPATDSVKWTVPALGNSITVLQQNNERCELMFSDTGRFAVTMRAYYPSGCIEDSTKYINVIPQSGPIAGGSQGNAYLKAYAVIYPNPNNGTFTVDLKFSEVTKARLRLINTLTNLTVDDRLIQGDDEYLLQYNNSLLSTGVYILVIEAAKGSFVYKVVIAY